MGRILTLSLSSCYQILEFYAPTIFKFSPPTLCNSSQYNFLPYHPNEIPLVKNISCLQIQWATSVLPLADLSALLDIVDHTLLLETWPSLVPDSLLALFSSCLSGLSSPNILTQSSSLNRHLIVEILWALVVGLLLYSLYYPLNQSYPLPWLQLQGLSAWFLLTSPPPSHTVFCFLWVSQPLWLACSSLIVPCVFSSQGLCTWFSFCLEPPSSSPSNLLFYF